MGESSGKNKRAELSREETSLTRSRRKSLGAFFTPPDQADFMVRTYGIHRDWAGGAVILDPTAGNGALLEALIRTALEDQIPITSGMLGRLKGIELEPALFADFRKRIQKTYHITFPAPPIEAGNILVYPSAFQADILFGNPPWLNFTDMSGRAKEESKPFFIHYGLAGSAGDLLLGNSRIDLAALVIMKTLSENLSHRGKAFFFSPLSLILNEGAHNRFRLGKAGSRNFSITEIRDYNGKEIFPEVATRCGFLCMAADQKMEEQIPYYILEENGSWQKKKAGPISSPGSAYVIFDSREEFPGNLPSITISKSSQPRQGINTGGCNDLFIFDRCEQSEKNLVRVSNRERTVILPDDLVFPLLSRKQFKGKTEPEKFIFLPYSTDGRALTKKKLTQYPQAYDYLWKNQKILENRKGVLLKNRMKKGEFWSLLGIGPYTFAPWKIVWESYGKKEFLPRIFSRYKGKPWIPNQALQAYCPFSDKQEASRVLKELRNPAINLLLQKQRMQGTCNWAQPGRIKVFLNME